MPLWGKTDTLASAPKYLTDVEKEDVYFVDITEAGIDENREKGIKTSGWVSYKTYTDANGNVRNKSEVLVAMAVPAVDAGDVGVTGNTVIEDSTVADS